MVSRRNFFSICMIMATILALFLFSLLIQDFINEYDVNVFLTETKLTSSSAWSELSADGSTQTVVYIGDGDGAEARIIRQWCGYTKRRFTQCGSLEDYAFTDGGGPVLLCLTGGSVATAGQAGTLSALVEAGQNVFFCDVSDTAHLAQFPELRTLLGIREIVREQVELTGIKLFSGFFLGGEAVYSMQSEEEEPDRESSLSAPWYLRLAGTKVYMVGMLEDAEVENEDLPPLIWRNSHGRGRVFAVNGPYMQDETGLGILSAVLYELQDYELYPVVNAQNLSVASFPNFSMENTQLMTEIYARNLRRLQMDLIWPNLIAGANKGGYQMTCFLAPQLDYGNKYSQYANDLAFYLQQFRERNTEAGLSMDCLPGTDFEEKLTSDQAFFDAALSAYSYSAAYVGGGEREALLNAAPQELLENIRTVTGVWDDADLLSYCTDTIVAQGVTADGFTHPYLQDLRVRAIETALAYSNILLDMKRVSWPEEGEPHWEILSENYSSNINTYWNRFSAFEKTTLTESDGRVRAFFAVDYRDARQGDTVTLEITNSDGDRWFLLRTHAEVISGLTGGDYVEIEEDAYLIHALEEDLEIRLEARRNSQYYLP